VGSRLLRAPSGRVVAVEITSPTLPDLEKGYRFRVLGNEIGTRGFRFTGEPTGRPPLLAESAVARRAVGHHRDAEVRVWTDADKAEARRLQAEGLSQSKIAEAVCGDRKFRSTVQQWLRPEAVAANGDSSGVAPGYARGEHFRHP
jgi:hypothetical protein